MLKTWYRKLHLLRRKNYTNCSDARISNTAPKNSEKRELRIMLVGKTGIGKSAVGNAILGRNAFESRPSLSSVTKECKKETAEFHGQKLAVVDTPGLFDTHRSVADVVKKIMECISLLSPGPHAILVMLQLNRFTKEEQETVKIIQEMFGNEAQKHTMVLFTHGDMLKGGNDTIEELISDNDQVKDFIRQCHGGYHVLDCKDNNQAQISELLQKINRMVQRNGDFYTNKMFQEAEKSNKEEMETIQRGNPWMDPQEARRRAERNNMLIRVVSTTPAQVFIRARAGSGSGAEFGAEFGAGGAQTSGVFRTIIEAVQRLARFVRNKLCITQ